MSKFLIGHFSTLLFAIVFFGYSTQTQANEGVEEKCVVLLDQNKVANIEREFSGFYNTNLKPQTFEMLTSNSNLSFFDCGYFFIVETRPKTGVFGAETSFLFEKKGFRFIANVFIQ